jgi:hypothetical protein
MNYINCFKLSLLFSFFVASCSKDNSSESNPSNSSIDFVTIGNSLEVMKQDLGNYDYNTALNECTKLSNRWRLPTTKEWLLICNNRDKVPNLVFNVLYWSSEINPGAANSVYGYFSRALTSSSCEANGYLYKNELHYTRAVRSK